MAGISAIGAINKYRAIAVGNSAAGRMSGEGPAGSADSVAFAKDSLTYEVAMKQQENDKNKK